MYIIFIVFIQISIFNHHLLKMLFQWIGSALFWKSIDFVNLFLDSFVLLHWCICLSQGFSISQGLSVSALLTSWANNSFLWRGLLSCALCVRAKSLLMCPTLCNPMDLPGSSVHGIFRARILERVAISYSRGFSQPRDQTHISYISCSGRQILYPCTTHLTPRPTTPPSARSQEATAQTAWLSLWRKMLYKVIHLTQQGLVIFAQITCRATVFLLLTHPFSSLHRLALSPMAATN